MDLCTAPWILAGYYPCIFTLVAGYDPWICALLHGEELDIIHRFNDCSMEKCRIRSMVLVSKSMDIDG